MKTSSQLYKLRVGLGLIQVGLIILLTLDGAQVSVMRIQLSELEAISRQSPALEESLKSILKSLGGACGVTIILLVSQSVKMLALAVGLHRNKLRLTKMSGIWVMDIAHVILMSILIVLNDLKVNKQDISHGFGIALSIASCCVTFVLVFKLRKLDDISLPKASLLYKLRVALGLVQVGHIVILTLIGLLLQDMKILEKIYKENIDLMAQHAIPEISLVIEEVEILARLCNVGFFICLAFIVIQCLRMLILVFGLHKNNPVFISVSGIIDVMNVPLFAWLICLLYKLEKEGLPHNPFAQHTVYFGIGISISSAFLSFLLSLKL